MTGHVWLFSRIRAPRRFRQGITRSWPAVVLPVRRGKHDRTVCGLYFRVGVRALVASRLPK